MNLHDYFETTTGLGVLATADAAGKVDAAVYARPHVIDEQTVAFLMADRRSHANLQANPHAVYLFREDGPGYQGLRLGLSVQRESDDPELADSLRRPSTPDRCRPAQGEKRFVVYFRIDEHRPLVGNGE
jgi:hypothetical protein